MAGANLTINGGFNSQTGLVSIPSALSSNLNQFLQQYLDGVSSSIMGSTIGFENNDVASANNDFTAGPAVPGLEEITNTDSVGGTVAGSGSYANITASNYAKTLFVQAPGNATITANSVTSTAIFGANSNVDYIDSTASPASIYGAGGNDTISLLLNGNRQSDDTIVAAGTSLVQLLNVGADVVSLTGNDQVRILKRPMPRSRRLEIPRSACTGTIKLRAAAWTSSTVQAMPRRLTALFSMACKPRRM